MQQIGYVDRKWKPKQKTPLQIQIEKEDDEWFAQRPVVMVERDYRKTKLILSEAAKEALAKGMRLFHSVLP